LFFLILRARVPHLIRLRYKLEFMSKRKKTRTDNESLRARAEELLSAKPDDVPTLPTADVQALIEELRQAQLALAQSRDSYSELYDSAPFGYVTLDADGRILQANLTASAMLRVDRETLSEAKLGDWLDRDSQGAFDRHRQAVFSGDEKQNCEVGVHTPDGTRRILQLESIAIGAADSRLCRTALLDVTERTH